VIPAWAWLALAAGGVAVAGSGRSSQGRRPAPALAPPGQTPGVAPGQSLWGGPPTPAHFPLTDANVSAAATKAIATDPSSAHLLAFAAACLGAGYPGTSTALAQAAAYPVKPGGSPSGGGWGAPAPAPTKPPSVWG